jgi:cell division protein FtsB
MKKAKNQPLITGTQFVAIVILTISIFLIIDLGRRATAQYHVSQAERRLTLEIDDTLAQQTRLEARRDYVASDAYVEEWAREQAHMIRPGDQPVILVTTEAPRTAPRVSAPQAPPAAEEVPNWYYWWELFFAGDVPAR